MAAYVFGGFSLAALQRYPMNDPTTMPPVVHLHGVAFISWMTLLTVQTGLINVKNVALHRSLGTFGIALGTAVLFTGMLIWTLSMGNGDPGAPFYYDLNFLSLAALSGSTRRDAGDQRSHNHHGRRQHRRLGPLRPRLPARGDREPIRVEVGASPLRRTTRGDSVTRWAHAAYVCHGCPRHPSHPVPSPFEVPDMYGRPWAQIWEKHWEQGMSRPQQDDIFDFE